MVCPNIGNIKCEIRNISRRICEIEHRIDVLNVVFIPRGTWETVGRYLIERQHLQSDLDNLYIQLYQLESQLAILSRL